jgi:hypothetical protein
VANLSVPLIRVADNACCAVTVSVWFTAPALGGPWHVAREVPELNYTIRPVRRCTP